MPKGINLAADKHADSNERLQVEQRRHRRIPTSLNVEVAWVDGFGFKKAAAAVVKDISAGGFGIELYRHRPAGSRLTVTTQTNAMACIVRHVRAVRDEFYLGLEIMPSVDEITKAKESLENLRTALSRDTADE